MSMHDSILKTKNGHSEKTAETGRRQGIPETLPNCPFLTIKRSSENNHRGVFEQIICEAGGGFVLGTMSSINEAQKICHSCDIPISLKFKYACLYLVPFRVFLENHVQSYYGCRWYFSLNPQKAPKNMDWCSGCRFWFPRPGESQIPDQARISQKFLRIFLNPSENLDRPTPDLREEERRWYERLQDIFYW